MPRQSSQHPLERPLLWEGPAEEEGEEARGRGSEEREDGKGERGGRRGLSGRFFPFPSVASVRLGSSPFSLLFFFAKVIVSFLSLLLSFRKPAKSLPPLVCCSCEKPVKSFPFSLLPSLPLFPPYASVPIDTTTPA
jgi:hypothetical protein